MVSPWEFSRGWSADYTRTVVSIDMENNDARLELNAEDMVERVGSGNVYEAIRTMSLYRGRYLMYYKDQEHLVTQDLLDRRRSEIVAKKAFVPKKGV